MGAGPGPADTSEVTIVCPKCMHKSADEETVCGRCGGLLLSAAQKRKLVVDQADEAPRTMTASDNGVGLGSTRVAQRVGERVAVKEESAEAKAIREALEYLGSSDESPAKAADRRTAADRRSTTDRRQTGGPPTPARKVNSTWLVTIGITLLVAIGLGLFLGLGGGSNASSPTSTTGPSASAATVSLFQFTGSGPSTTGPFTAGATFTFSYTVNCPKDLATPAVFQLLRAGRSVGQVSSSVGGLRESGNQPSFGTVGTFTVSVNAPPTCTWTISGNS